MPDDGSGNYTRVSGSAYTNGTTADGPELDAEMNDIAAALTNRLLRSGAGAMTGALNMGGNGINNLGVLDVTTNASAAAFRAGNGTSALPSYQFTDATNTGFYAPATYWISFVTNGSRALTIDNSQRVGVKTNTPLDPLHVTGDARIQNTTTPALKFYAGTTAIGDVSGTGTTLTVKGNTSTSEVRLSASDKQGVRVIGRGTQADTLIGSPSMSTTSTNGHAYIPAVSGAPTGVPTGSTGHGAIQIDTANNRLYVYVSGAWRYASLSV